jgi:hypothetical protein
LVIKITTVSQSLEIKLTSPYWIPYNDRMYDTCTYCGRVIQGDYIGSGNGDYCGQKCVNEARAAGTFVEIPKVFCIYCDEQIYTWDGGSVSRGKGVCDMDSCIEKAYKEGILTKPTPKWQKAISGFLSNSFALYIVIGPILYFWGPNEFTWQKHVDFFWWVVSLIGTILGWIVSLFGWLWESIFS